jgi:hypothetical protein
MLPPGSLVIEILPRMIHAACFCTTLASTGEASQLHKAQKQRL